MCEKYGRNSRREMFLDEMEIVVPWSAMEPLVRPHYAKAGEGRHPVGLSIMLRTYSDDLRRKLLEASDAGKASPRKLPMVFGLSADCGFKISSARPDLVLYELQSAPACSTCRPIRPISIPSKRRGPNSRLSCAAKSTYARSASQRNPTPPTRHHRSGCTSSVQTSARSTAIKKLL